MNDCVARVKLHSRDFVALFDSGSALSMVALSVVQQLGVAYSLSHSSLILADGSSVSARGRVEIPVEFSGRTVRHTFLVLENCAFAVIVGRDAMRRFGITMSFSSGPNEANITAASFSPNISSHLTADEKQRLSHLLAQYTECFHYGTQPLSTTSETVHSIKLKPEAVPFRQRPYRVPYNLRAEVQRQIDEMLRQGVIRKSSSPWCSPFFLVPKKNGRYRFVIDFRRLNDLTVKDAHPVPHPDDLQMNLSGARYFSTLDCASGYWQIPMEETSRPCTAFEANGSLYEFCVMPFGLCNGVATFQRMMVEILSGLSAKPYVDDILVASASFDEHLSELEQVLIRVRSANLRLQPDKCVFAAPETNYLGHIVSADGVRPDPAKVRAIKEFPAPSSKKEADRFCGLVNYLSRFLHHLAQLLSPIFKAKSARNRFVWSADCEAAFKEIKARISQDTLLCYPRWNEPFELHVDASAVAAGAMLKQSHGVIAYFSRTFKSAEKNYSATDREFTALVMAVKHFRPFLFGSKVFAYTDHQPLIGLLRPDSSPRNGRHARFLTTLQEYDITPCYIRGTEHFVPDALSRMVAESNIPTFRSTLNTNAEPFLCAVRDTEIDDLILRYHNAGHFGTNRVRQNLLLAGHWFPRMRARIHGVSSRCEICRAKSYASSPPRGTLPKDSECEPRELVAVDIIGPLPAATDFRYILTLIDHSTKFMAAVALRTITADSVVKAVENEWILRYGPPMRFLHDNGTQFTSAQFRQMCQRNNITDCPTTPYNPQGNGLLERAHRVLKDRLRCALLSHQGYWSDHLQRAIFNINQTSAGAFLGFQPRIPGDQPTIKISLSRCKLRCPRVVFPRVHHPTNTLAPRFGPALRVEQRLSPQLIRTSDGIIRNMRNCRVQW